MTAKDLYQSVTDSIVKALEEGNLTPWRKGWQEGGAFFPLRHNGTAYRGVNTLLLWLSSHNRGFASPYFMTFKQAKEYGGCVRKGEKSTPILWCEPVTKKATADDGTESEDRFWISKTYAVFNADQVEGLPDRFYARPVPTLDASQRIEHAEHFIMNTGAEIEHGGFAAYYMKLSDKISLPAFEFFHTPEAYYGTCLHELVHWTGANWRLARFDHGKESRGEYAKEEIVAELAACFLAAQLGIEPAVMPDHHAYLDFWIQALREDARYIFRAASQAQAACDYLTDLQPKPE
ncbi:MAG: hypothetical protein BGO49_24815 [Planctomycetales bacterium 71-10]|nr:MAG: hypothetical protein BGO49_24815 [Planctomycetales bacterium 71-10]